MFKRLFSIVAFLCLGVAPMAACSLPADEGSTDEPVSAAESALQFCGGIAGIQCPAGQVCVDDPRDDCDPDNGGADCGGICIARVKPLCELTHPNATWVSHDPLQCQVVKFVCPPGKTGFSDKCGCGCEPALVPGGEPCGGNTCGAGTYCCNASCGICAPTGGACTQQYCGPVL